jgi:hypothetical protein
MRGNTYVDGFGELRETLFTSDWRPSKQSAAAGWDQNIPYAKLSFFFVPDSMLQAADGQIGDCAMS